MEGLKRVGRLATKYMGKQHGWGGGTLLSISSSTELAPGLEREPGQCTVLGTTRALGLAPGVARSVGRYTYWFQTKVHEYFTITEKGEGPY